MNIKLTDNEFDKIITKWGDTFIFSYYTIKNRTSRGEGVVNVEKKEIIKLNYRKK